MDNKNHGANVVPVLPILGILTLAYAWMLEVLIGLGYWFSGGNWPSPVKFWVVAGVLVIATVYKRTMRKVHRAYDKALAGAQLNGKQLCVILLFLSFWVALLVWLAIGPPGPEFRPV
jgi:hypothetical protein